MTPTKSCTPQGCVREQGVARSTQATPSFFSPEASKPRTPYRSTERLASVHDRAHAAEGDHEWAADGDLQPDHPPENHGSAMALAA